MHDYNAAETRTADAEIFAADMADPLTFTVADVEFYENPEAA